MRILLVDDNLDNLHSLETVLEDLGHQPACVQNAQEALNQVAATYFPLIITDIRMPGMDGIELLGRLKQMEGPSRSDVVILTGHGDMHTAIQALRKGAYDYLNKPINARELAAVVERSAEHQDLLQETSEWRRHFHTRVEEATQDLQRHLHEAQGKLREVAGLGRVVAASPAMRRLLDETRVYHKDPEVPVLIEGETGTGKEILARLVHFGEQVSTAPFLAINCSAIPAALFESELFGHEPGAYTGSSRKGRQGKLELAENGTVFLDEVAEMSLELQPKLLRVLEDGTFYRVGGVKKRRLRARVICAANRDIEALVGQGAFRRDLFHRLKVGHLHIPPLRDRPEDIPPLAAHFLQREAARKKKAFSSIHDDALALLVRQRWPGNVRELENAIERAVLTRDGTVLMPEHLDFLPDAPAVPAPGPARTAVDAQGLPRVDLPEAGLDLEALNRKLVRAVLQKFGGNKTRAAQYLGLSRYALHRRLQKE